VECLFTYLVFDAVGCRAVVTLSEFMIDGPSVEA